MSSDNQEFQPIRYPSISSGTLPPPYVSAPTVNPFSEPPSSATEYLLNPFSKPTSSATESEKTEKQGTLPPFSVPPETPNPLPGPSSSAIVSENAEKWGTPPPSSVSPQTSNPLPGPSSSATVSENMEKWGTPPPPSVMPQTPNPPPGPSSSATVPENTEKWGTHVMGTPAVPTCHPSNQKAALWGVADQKDYQNHHQPYIQYDPINKSNISGTVLQKFNSWSAKAETTANNIWHNLKTGSSVSGAAWGKVNLRAKAITGGGFDTLYKQTFATYPNEMLKKTFACYLSTSTGPVSGTLYLSNVHVAFCSDCPLSFTAPSGQETWSYYKILIPLANIGSINPVIMRGNQTERYIQLISTDGHDFWFMGFVNYEKATSHLFDSISKFAAAGVPVAQPAPVGSGGGGKHI